MREIHESFAIADRMIDPDVPDARYVTTALQVACPLEPEDLLTPWYRWPRGSARRQFALLHQWFGGYYPVIGLLEECARPYFSLTAEVDGTAGYGIANRYRIVHAAWIVHEPGTGVGHHQALATHPWANATVLEGYYVEQAWEWQVEGPVPPTTLLRQTWTRNAQVVS
jgi:hypothetical protein